MQMPVQNNQAEKIHSNGPNSNVRDIPYNFRPGV